jgi:tRNA(Ile)-lysidine synthase
LVNKGQNTTTIAVSDLVPGKTASASGPALAPFRVMPRALNKRIIRAIVEDLKPGSGQLGHAHVQAVLTLAERGENGKSLPLPGGVEVRRDHDQLIFLARPVPAVTPNKNQSAAKQFQYGLALPTTSNNDVVLRVPCLARVFRLTIIDWPSKRGETSVTRSVLDRHALRAPLVLRSWLPGDRFQPLGHRNAHKLKRLLSKKRISRWDREGWPVLTSGGVLVWARGFPVAAQFAASERTQSGILIAEEPLS